MTNKKTEIITGLLFIIATASSSLGFIIIDPVIKAPDILVAGTVNSSHWILGVLFLLINCIAVVIIPVLLFPVFKKHSEVLAVGYIGSRIVESLILIVGSISLLSLLTLSGEFLQAEALDISYFQSSAIILLASYEWSHLIGIMIFFSFSALTLNTLLYISELIPRWLSGWGLIGATMLLISGMFEIFGLNPLLYFTLPIALQEMVFAVWLIVKGFNLNKKEN